MKPILFNTDMVRAILDNLKTVTRRAVKPQPPENIFVYNESGKYFWSDMECRLELKMPHRPGDILYVRETWNRLLGDWIYKADQKLGMKNPGKWHPSIHMPREAARIFLRVTGVRVERLQSITELDILEKEGVTVDFPQPKPSYMSLAYTETRLKPAVRKAFADLWNSTIKPADHALYGWDANPWVWVIEFERCEKPEGD